MKNQSIIEHAIEGLNNLRESNIEGSELHHNLFNVDYFIIGRYQAEQWLIANGGVFNAIGEIQKYETDNFGQVSTDLSESEKVANMYSYILGEELLQESKVLQDNWDNELSPETIDLIIEELENLLITTLNK